MLFLLPLNFLLIMIFRMKKKSIFKVRISIFVMAHLLLKKLSVTMSIALYPKPIVVGGGGFGEDRGQSTLPCLPGLISILITEIEMLPFSN